MEGFLEEVALALSLEEYVEIAIWKSPAFKEDLVFFESVGFTFGSWDWLVGSWR